MSTTFWALPRELRDEIYMYSLASHDACTSQGFPVWKSLVQPAFTRVNSQMRDEGLRTFYRKIRIDRRTFVDGKSYAKTLSRESYDLPGTITETTDDILDGGYYTRYRLVLAKVSSFFASTAASHPDLLNSIEITVPLQSLRTKLQSGLKGLEWHEFGIDAVISLHRTAANSQTMQVSFSTMPTGLGAATYDHAGFVQQFATTEAQFSTLRRESQESGGWLAESYERYSRRERTLIKMWIKMKTLKWIERKAAEGGYDSCAGLRKLRTRIKVLESYHSVPLAGISDMLLTFGASL